VTDEPVETQDETVEAVDPAAAIARERDEYLDALQRLKAEFDNYRKRVGGGGGGGGGGE
jgi:molecular chaperone GrpE (heat shock protein)